MNNLQFYVYLIGIIFFFIGVYFYYQKRKNEINEKQKLFRNRAMYLLKYLIIKFLTLTKYILYLNVKKDNLNSNEY